MTSSLHIHRAPGAAEPADAPDAVGNGPPVDGLPDAGGEPGPAPGAGADTSRHAEDPPMKDDPR